VLGWKQNSSVLDSMTLQHHFINVMNRTLCCVRMKAEQLCNKQDDILVLGWAYHFTDLKEILWILIAQTNIVNCVCVWCV